MNRVSILLLISVLMTILHPTAMANSSQNVSDEPAGEPSTTEYLPMFDIGKEWRYQLYWPDNPFEETQPNRIRTLKVDETREINGQTYFVANAYTDNATQPDMNEPYGYFRENIEERKVYFIPNKNYSVSPIRHHAFYYGEVSDFDETERSLYDFRNGHVYEESNGNAHKFSSTISIPSPAGELKGYCDERKSYTHCIVEGIGHFITDADGVPLTHEAYDLLGIPPLVAGFGQGYVTLLYSVVDGKGNELISIDGNRLEAGIESMNADTITNAAITNIDGKLHITATSAIGKVEIFNLDGKCIYSGSFNNSRATIATDTFAPGIYMMKACGMVRKTRIR